MVSEPLADTLRELQKDAPAALYPVIEAFLQDRDDAPEVAWQAVLKETLDED